ncbi:unnamed protein product [Danaus chrysippus]|uniref:Gustatory receptor n=1 Tax=Danaus chrysippus TaxID=151541 RepID=A0A8J2VY70_9NEOP|nr:unnamed protein product [Danaus chrysippus]
MSSPELDEASQSVIDFLTANVRKRDESDITNELKKDFLLAKKKSKEKKRKPNKKKSRILGRKERKSLGFYTIQRNAIKYNEMLPLNKVWCEYMSQLLELDQPVPGYNSKNWEQFSQTLHKADFHGSYIQVVRSKCPSYVGKKDVAVIAGFAIDLQTDPSRSLRTSTPTSCIVWVSNVTIVIMIASAGVYQGSGRFATNINTLKQMIEIKTFIGLKAESYSDSNNSLSVTFMSSALCFLLVTDLFSWVKEAIYSDKDGKSLTRYLYPSDSIGITTLNNYVLNRPKRKSLLKPDAKLLYRTSFTDESKDGDLEVINGGNIRNTSIAYGLICDVLREINDNYGIVLLFVVLSFFLQLIITPYYMLTALYR